MGVGVGGWGVNWTVRGARGQQWGVALRAAAAAARGLETHAQAGLLPLTG